MYVIEGACDAADAPIAPVVTDPLKVVGRVYTPFLLANAAALAAGEAPFSITAMGLPDPRGPSSIRLSASPIYVFAMARLTRRRAPGSILCSNRVKPWRC